MPTLDELLKGKTASELMTALLNRLQGKGFPITDWTEGGVERTQLEVEAAVLADVHALVPTIAKGGFLDTSTGDWLTLYAKSQYNEERKAAVFTVDTIRLTCAVGSGPVNIAAGQLWATDATGLLFNNGAAGIIPDGGTLDLEFTAEQAGSKYNLARGAINKLVTSLPGVTITNTTLVTTGADVESDESLRSRCRLKWQALGGATAGAYAYWALSSNSAITKARVLDNQPRGRGTVDVIVAGDGALGADVVTAATDYIAAKKPITDDVSTYAATERSIAITGTGKVKAGNKAKAETEIADNLSQLEKDTAIGGVLYDGAVWRQVMNAIGMVDATFTGLADQTALATAEFLTLTIDFAAGFVLTEV